MKKPEIETYFDYREYLKDLFEWSKSCIDIFSHRYIVQKAGYKSPTVLKDVIDKKKNLTLVSLDRFANAFKMSPAEREYLVLLFKFNTAETAGEKDALFNELTQFRTENPHRIIANEELDILDHWWTLALREAISLPDYKHSKKWLARNIQPEISESDVEQSLQVLELAGMIRKVDGQWESCDSVIKTDHNVRSIKVSRFHKQMIALAQKALWEVPSSEREISGTMITIPLEKVGEIKKRLYDVRQSILAMASECENADQVFQLNFQLFPLVKIDRSKRTNSSKKDQ